MPNFNTPDEYKAFMHGLLTKHQNRMEYLYDRWQDEKEYEDWGDYADEMKKMFGDLFCRAMKRPFGVVINISIKGTPSRVKLTVNSRSIGYKLEA